MKTKWFSYHAFENGFACSGTQHMTSHNEDEYVYVFEFLMGLNDEYVYDSFTTTYDGSNPINL